MCRRPRGVVLALALSVAWPTLAHGDDEGLDAARRLYAAAAYEDALRALERLLPSASDPRATLVVQQQRLLCLIALGRAADAEQAMTAMVRADPLYEPDAAAAPPRVRTAFHAVRVKLMPEIARAEYDRARQAFEASDFQTADAGFARVIALVESVPGADSDPVLRDVHVLADGFKTLSEKAAAQPKPAAPAPASGLASPAVEAPAATEAAASGEPPAVMAGPRVYDSTYPSILAPAIVRQEVPQWPQQLGPLPHRDGLLEVVINEEGAVESARMRHPVNRAYDQIVLAATTAWSYVPAKVDGEPVKFRKIIKLSFR
jgi:tetratricopeptide (TPR) repeat protein